jgi:hypothetical protein
MRQASSAPAPAPATQRAATPHAPHRGRLIFPGPPPRGHITAAELFQPITPSAYTRAFAQNRSSHGLRPEPAHHAQSGAPVDLDYDQEANGDVTVTVTGTGVLRNGRIVIEELHTDRDSNPQAHAVLQIFHNGSGNVEASIGPDAQVGASASAHVTRGAVQAGVNGSASVEAAHGGTRVEAEATAEVRVRIFGTLRAVLSAGARVEAGSRSGGGGGNEVTVTPVLNFTLETSSGHDDD